MTSTDFPDFSPDSAGFVTTTRSLEPPYNSNFTQNKGDGTRPRLASAQNWIQRGNIRNDKIKAVSLEVSDTIAKGHAINNLEIISGSEICIVKKIKGSR